MSSLQSIQAQREAIKRKREAARANQLQAATAATAAATPTAGVAAQPAGHSGALGSNEERSASPQSRASKVPRVEAAAASLPSNNRTAERDADDRKAASSSGTATGTAFRPITAAAAAAAPPLVAPSPASAADAALAAAVTYIPSLNIPTGASRVPQHWRNVDMAHSIQSDLSQNFVSTGQRPQNFIRDSEAAENDEAGAGGQADDRYDGDPEFAQFVRLKRELVEEWATRTPYMAHRHDLRQAISNERQLAALLGGYEFDVIVVDPPWQEYQDRAVGVQAPRAERAGLANDVWSMRDLQRLPIASIAAEPCLLFLWCGSGRHLAEGQQLINAWGFKQVEDICWLQTNQSNPSRQGYTDDNAIFQRTHEHCLMGIRGESFVLRDRHIECMSYAERIELGLVQFVHPGADIDCIISESPPIGSTRKPEQLYSLIERYCVGRRRLELFGSDDNIRRGWLTIGSAISAEMDNFDMDRYMAMFEVEPTEEADATAGSDASGPKQQPQYVTKHPPSAAAIAAQQQRDREDRRTGRFDARLSHYIPHTVELERVRPKSPATQHRPSVRRPTRPRQVWNRGITAGMRALQAQMRDEGRPGFASTSAHMGQPGGSMAGAPGGGMGDQSMPPHPHSAHPPSPSQPQPQSHSSPLPARAYAPQPHFHAPLSSHPSSSSFAPIAPVQSTAPSRWPAPVAPAPVRSLSPQPQFF